MSLSRGLTLCALTLISYPVLSEELGEGKPVSQYTDLVLPSVSVVGTTPLSSTKVPLNKVPGNIQSTESEDIYRYESLDMTDYMNRALSSVSVNSALANPYQLDINYRGFSASPILGTPIGMSVYQDGVRVNEAFGDTVNWDLIPRFAIANMEVIPGSNPLFGLNTLGGALAIRSKSGLTHPGSRGQFYGGSFGRKALEVEHGGSHGPFDWYFGGNVFEEDGFRKYSHSSVGQGFAKLGWENEKTDVELSYTFAQNNLTGNGAAPASLVSGDPTAVYAHPEISRPRLHFVNLALSQLFEKDWSLTGNAYYRYSSIGVTAGDVELEPDPVDKEFERDPVINSTQTRQHGVGGALQLSYLGDLFGMENQAILGSSYDSGDTDFTQHRQPGALTDSRGVIPAGADQLLTRLNAQNRYYGAFLTDTLSPTPWLHLTASGRWNKAEIQLAGFGSDPEGETESLTGNHSFNRFNPAAGFTVQPFKALNFGKGLEDLTVFTNYNEGFRVPTPVELTCADPTAPCALPTNFVSDPPLKPIVANTWETGVRGSLLGNTAWNITYFHTALSNDILFINSPGTTTRGYFKNVGSTLRQGVELGLNGKLERFNWYANYSFLEATYESNLTLENALGPVSVSKGDHIPSLPSHLVKFGADYEVLPNWFIGGNLIYNGSRYLRGDDNNQHAQVPDYVIVNLNSRYNVTKNVQVFAMANNVFDERYQTFGLLNRNAFSDPAGRPEAFVTPGASISGWAGIRVRFD